MKTAIINLTFDEINHLLGAIDYVRERYRHEGMDLTSFGNPKILERAEHKLENTRNRMLKEDREKETNNKK